MIKSRYNNVCESINDGAEVVVVGGEDGSPSYSVEILDRHGNTHMEKKDPIFPFR